MSADASRVRAALESWAFQVQSAAVDDTPDLVRPLAPISTPSETSDRIPGQLRESITVSQPVQAGGTVFVGRVAAPVPQAEWTDRGTSAHEIVPRGPGYPLRFFSQGSGAIVFAMRVQHPGNPPGNWWTPAVTAAWGQALLARAQSTPFA